MIGPGGNGQEGQPGAYLIGVNRPAVKETPRSQNFFYHNIKGRINKDYNTKLPVIDKAKSDDAVWSGLNRQGFRVIAAADGASKSYHGYFMSEKLVHFISENSGSDLDTLKDSLQKAQDEAYEQSIKQQDKGLNSGATLVAGVVDAKNILHFVGCGDARGFILRNGKLIQINTIDNKGIHNPKAEEVEYLMRKKGITRSQADKLVAKGKNKPRAFASNGLNIPELFEKKIQLQKGDELFFVTDGILDGACETYDIFRKNLIYSAKQTDPAKALAGLSLENWRKAYKDGIRDDMSAAYMRI